MRTIADILMELGQNSIEAKASIINIKIAYSKKQIKIIFYDNGCGSNNIKLITDPFYTTKEEGGLGLSLINETIIRLGGKLKFRNKNGFITKLIIPQLLETPDIGSLDEVVLILSMALDIDLEFKYYKTIWNTVLKNQQYLIALEKMKEFKILMEEIYENN